MKQSKIELHNCDCMDYMKTCKDNDFDLAIVDPPYGINISNRSGSIGQRKGQGRITKYKKCNWDDNKVSKNYIFELFRISKNQIIWGANYYNQYLPMDNGWIIWDKKQPEEVTFAMAELAYTSFKKSNKIFSCSRALIGNAVSNNIRKAQINKKIHPTQKPVQLYKWLLKNYTKPGDKIFDSHLGSGSIAIACFDMGFDLVGCEIDKEYYEAALKRFKIHKQQLKLF